MSLNYHSNNVLSHLRPFSRFPVYGPSVKLFSRSRHRLSLPKESERWKRKVDIFKEEIKISNLCGPSFILKCETDRYNSS